MLAAALNLRARSCVARESSPTSDPNAMNEQCSEIYRWADFSSAARIPTGFPAARIRAMAFSMVLLWPFYALLRRIRGIKDPIPGGTEAVATVNSPEIPIDGSHSSA